MVDCINALKQWTRKETSTIVFDSTVDEFTGDGLFEKVKGIPNIAVVGFTTEGDVFGGFYRIVVTTPNKSFRDPDMFVFSFESHGRCETPKRFLVKSEKKGDASVLFFKNHTYGFISFDGESGWLFLGNQSSNTWCHHLARVFEGVYDTTLTGKKDRENFTCTRLAAVQLQN